ncbi:hypothetical protein HYH02_012543 [Chlamydomonas schloesseri]|uniref:HMG box domain-containing protein n=1 Tax=Chlamydomonas schloesseri TaxID=2026947 RepID=A0A835SUU7_9CHLO|nr:hypothetical protein HYH02_012543 [Chlamydomonas schloesseri]|eukprot:KAG2433614.1 hypothetical protein HYH02_012543 [Chlamydomonas schloesseri]
MPKRGAEQDEGIELPRYPLRTGFLQFIKANRDAVQAANPGLPNSELAKLLGRRYSELGAEEQREYTRRASRDTARFKKEIHALKEMDVRAIKEHRWESPLERLKRREGAPRWLRGVSNSSFRIDRVTGELIPAPRDIKDPDTPKPPKPAYAFFSGTAWAKIRAENPGPSGLTKL